MNNKQCIPLGDRHDGKRVSLIIEGETKYLFKPRNACAEKGLEAFLLQLKQEGFSFLPECEHIIEETQDGFKTAYVEHTPAESEEDVALYFKRCGALIFFAYLFGANDLHYENIIASKNTPVIIDSETLMTGRTEAESGSLKSLASSVMKSHLLPNWRLEDGKARLAAGLISDLPSAESHLLYNGAPCYIYDYEDDVTKGFCSAYCFAEQHQHAVIKALNCFKESCFRFLLRPTEVYAKIAELADKLDKEKREPSVRLLLSEGYRRDRRAGRLEAMERVLNEEINAVLSGDIPRFYIRYDGLGLYSDDGEIASNFLSATPESCVKEKLSSLSPDDMTAQCRIITQSLATARPIEKRVSRPYSGNLFEVAFARLEEGYISAISSGFAQLDANSNGNLFFQSAGFGLYDGLAGILCAYAALYRKTKSPAVLTALKAHYAPLGDYINASDNIVLNESTVSLQSGVSGILACLMHIFELTNEPIFYDDAITLAKKLKPEFSGKIPLDLLGGIAGLALQLSKLPTEVSAPIAGLLLPELLKYEPKLTGAAHGAAGIALAIAALSADENSEKILQLLDFEEHNYYKTEQNWRDLRVTDRVAFMHGWCSGVGGEAMVRQALLGLTESKEITAACSRDLKRAQQGLCSDFTVKRDCLCCGNAARLMALSNISSKNSGLYTLLCDKIMNDDIVLTHPNGTDDKNYGLMQGIAGVIYAVAMYEDEKSGGMLLC